ncbi:MAG TPA: protein kinase [Acidobacteriaceae bacterium]|jgi:serine/threonine protein kinase
MVPQVGQKIGPYEILGRLGTGGMGLVFSAWDSRLHRDVAIKLLRDEFVTSTMRQRFLAEARAVSRLNHPNICTIFDIGEQDGSPYMVMELLKGDTLRSRMQQGLMSIEDILCVAGDVAEALAVAHAHGIIHRDIKPANIVLVSKAGGRFQSKVLDFGLAKLEMDEGELSSGLTSTGMTVGTVSYMSPEQAKGELIDRRSDLFSLGTVLYEMATGKLPFSAATSALFFVRLLNEPPEPVRDLNGTVPRALEQIINICLQKDRNSRYQSAEDMVEALHKVVVPVPGAEKQSWISRLTGSKKPDSPSQSFGAQSYGGPSFGESQPLPGFSPDRTPPPADQPPRTPASGRSVVRPVKIGSGSGNDAAAGRSEPPQELPFPSATPPAPERPSLSDSVPEPEAVEAAAVTQAPATSTPAAPSAPVGTAAPPSAAFDSAPVPRIVFPPLTEEQRRNPSPRFQRIVVEDSFEGESEEQSAYSRAVAAESAAASRRMRFILGALLILLAVGASIWAFAMRHGSISSVPPPQTLMLTSVANHTGDSSLGGVVTAGLELSLQQSPKMALLGPSVSSAAAAENDPAGQAKSAGATAYVVGEIHNDGPVYAISLRVLDTTTGKRLGECDGTAASRERIAGAIDSLATNLRTVLGETGDVIGRNSVPLGREATTNLEALTAYANGEQLQSSGHMFDAMSAYEHAVTVDPQFSEAHLRLASLFRQQHAEVSAAAAANRAQAASANASDRTRLFAQAVYALDVDADYARATGLLQQVKTSYPYDLACLNTLALSQRLQGDFAGSLATARAALRLSTLDHSATSSAELALLALNRNDEAASLVRSFPAQERSGAEILVALLTESPADAGSLAAAVAGEDLDAQTKAASVLDAGGQFRDGLLRWRDIAQRASALPELSSAASFALSQGALNRALALDCSGAFGLLQTALGLPSGPAALFAQGATSGLCGDLAGARRSAVALNANYGQAFAVRGFYVSDLNALILWKSGLAADALITLESAKEYDALSFTPYLRGLVYFSEHQTQLANVEFQHIISQRGLTSLINTETVAMAQLNMARGYAAGGERNNAVQAYARLLALWPHGDAENPLVGEARAAVSQ